MTTTHKFPHQPVVVAALRPVLGRVLVGDAEHADLMAPGTDITLFFFCEIV